MKRFRAFFIFAFGLLELSSAASATVATPFFQGAREMGMGGAAIAVVNDETALLSNPAGLGKIRQSITTVIDPEIQMNSNFTTLGSANPSVITSPSQLLSDLQQPSNWNKNIFAKASVMPSFVTTNFGVGLYATDQVNGIVDPTGATLKLDYVNDYAALLGYNFRFFDGRIKLGITGKAIDRTEIHTTLPASTTNISINSLASSGQGLGADAGLLLTAPWEYLPSLAVVARDIGTTSFNLNHGMINPGAKLFPQSVGMTTDVGLSASPILGRGTRLQLTAEYTDVLTASQETNQILRTHFGAEINLTDVIFIRAGANQGYWTAGLEMNFGHIQIQFASYGQNVGTSASTLEDRRYVAKSRIALLVPNGKTFGSKCFIVSRKARANPRESSRAED